MARMDENKLLESLFLTLRDRVEELVSRKMQECQKRLELFCRPGDRPCAQAFWQKEREAAEAEFVRRNPHARLQLLEKEAFMAAYSRPVMLDDLREKSADRRHWEEFVAERAGFYSHARLLQEITHKKLHEPSAVPVSAEKAFMILPSHRQKVFTNLSGYFQKADHADLKKLIAGEIPGRRLDFMGNTFMLGTFFRQLRLSGAAGQPATLLARWIADSFTVANARGGRRAPTLPTMYKLLTSTTLTSKKTPIKYID